MADLRLATTRLRRAFLRHRRLIAATSAAAAALTAVQIFAPAPPPTSAVVVAAHDLSGGTVIIPADLRVVQMRPDLAPAGAATVEEAVGETVAGPMRTGEPLTDLRVVGAAMIAGYDGDVVAAPVRIQDQDVVALLRVGDRIDIYAAVADPDSTAVRIVEQAPVVALPQLEDDSRDGALVVLAVAPEDAAKLAQASATAPLSVSLRG
ncbi:MAG: SAF domain-containing protein [Nocardioidaceae bacterium]